MRRQLPVHSPLPFRALVRALFSREPDAKGRLARLLAERFEAQEEQVLLVGSGTDALGLALTGVARVALPAYTCWDVGTAAQGAGVDVSYYDVDPTHLTPDRASLQRALEAGADALVVSPLFGYPVAWDELADLCRKHQALLIEDAAQGHGASWRGRPVGSFGDRSVLSFGRGKGWTGAGGGALLVRDSRKPAPTDVPLEPAPPPPGWIAKAAAQSILARPGLYGPVASMPGTSLGRSIYHTPAPAREMAGAVARLVLETAGPAAQEARRRREIGASLLELISGSPSVRPIAPYPEGAGFLRLPVRIAAPSGDWLRQARRSGIERGYPLALPDVPELASLASGSLPAMPGARLLAAELFTLPTHGLVTAPELHRIARLLHRT